ncbi:unnamed protein product, partial [Closterium sp. NIES-53]
LASAFPPLAASLSAALRLPLRLFLQCDLLEEAVGTQGKLVQQTLAVTWNARHQVQTLLDLHASLRVSLKRRQIVLVAVVLQAIKQVESALAACLPSLSLHLALYQQHLLRQLNAALLPLQMDQLAKLPRPSPLQAHPTTGDVEGGSEAMGGGGGGIEGEVAGQPSSLSVAALLASAPPPAGSLFPWSNKAAMDTHKKLVNSIATLTSMLQLTRHQLPSDRLLSFLSTACALLPPLVDPIPSCQPLLAQLHFSTLLPSLSSSSSSSSTTTACFFLSSRPHLLAPALAALYSQPLIQPNSLQYLVDAFLDGARLLLQPHTQERHSKQSKEHTGRRSSSRSVSWGDIYSVENQLEVALVQSFLRPLTRDVIADLHLHAISHSDLHSSNPRFNPRKTGVRNLLQFLQLPPIRLLSRQIDIQAHVAQALAASLYNHTAASPANWKLGEDVRQLAASKYRLLLPPIAIGGGLAFRLHSAPTPSSTSSPALPFSLLHPPSLAANLPFFVSAFSFDLSTLTFHQRPSSLARFHEPSSPIPSTRHADSSSPFSSAHGPRSLTLRQLSGLLQSTHAMLFLQHAATSACKLIAGKLSHLSRLFLHDRAHSLLLQSMKQIQQKQQQQQMQQQQDQQETQATGLAPAKNAGAAGKGAAGDTAAGGGDNPAPAAAAGMTLTMEAVDELKNKLQEISVDPDWRIAKPAPVNNNHDASGTPASSSAAQGVAGKGKEEKRGRGGADKRLWGEVVVEEVREMGVALGFVLAAATAACHSAEHTLRITPPPPPPRLAPLPPAAPPPLLALQLPPRSCTHSTCAITSSARERLSKGTYAPMLFVNSNFAYLAAQTHPMPLDRLLFEKGKHPPYQHHQWLIHLPAFPSCSSLPAFPSCSSLPAPPPPPPPQIFPTFSHILPSLSGASSLISSPLPHAPCRHSPALPAAGFQEAASAAEAGRCSGRWWQGRPYAVAGGGRDSHVGDYCVDSHTLHTPSHLFQELQASSHRPFLTLPAAIPPLSLLLASKKQLAQQRLADAVAGGGRDSHVGDYCVDSHTLHTPSHPSQELQASSHRPFLTLPAAIPPLSLILASKKQLAQQRLADAVAGGGRDGRVGGGRGGGGSSGSEGGRGWEREGEGEGGAWEAQDDDWLPDDGFTLGVAFLLTVRLFFSAPHLCILSLQVTNQRLAFDSMDWFSLALHHLSFQRQAMPTNPPSTLTPAAAASAGGGGGGAAATAAGTVGGAVSGKSAGRRADAGEEDDEEEEGEGAGGAGRGVTSLWSSWFGATAASVETAASQPELSPELTHQLRQVRLAVPCLSTA